MLAGLEDRLIYDQRIVLVKLIRWSFFNPLDKIIIPALESNSRAKVAASARMSIRCLPNRSEESSAVAGNSAIFLESSVKTSEYSLGTLLALHECENDENQITLN